MISHLLTCVLNNSILLSFFTERDFCCIIALDAIKHTNRTRHHRILNMHYSMCIAAEQTVIFNIKCMQTFCRSPDNNINSFLSERQQCKTRSSSSSFNLKSLGIKIHTSHASNRSDRLSCNVFEHTEG